MYLLMSATSPSGARAAKKGTIKGIMTNELTVYVLNPDKGFEVARKGTNGFHTFVARTGDDTFRGSWPLKQYRDDILYPISFDEASSMKGALANNPPAHRQQPRNQLTPTATGRSLNSGPKTPPMPISAHETHHCHRVPPTRGLRRFGQY